MEITYDGTKFVAMLNGVEVASSKNRDYLKRKVSQMAEALPVAKAASQFKIDDRFTFTEQLVTMVATGQTASCVITGEGGLGKTYSVLKALKASGMSDVSELPIGTTLIGQRKYFRVVKGFSTAKGLYKILFENQTGILVFDDCDSVLKDPDAVNLLKGALDSYDKRYITWNTSLSDDGMPNSFEFKGGVVFISNMDKERISQAIRSRAMNVDLSMTTDEKLERMATIMKSDEFLPEIRLSHKEDALEVIRQNVESAKEISLRTLINVTKIRNSGNANWEMLAKYMLVQ